VSWGASPGRWAWARPKPGWRLAPGEELVTRFVVHGPPLGGSADRSLERSLEAGGQPPGTGLLPPPGRCGIRSSTLGRTLTSGGAGYLAENRLPMLRADTDVFTTFEGDNTVLLQLVAKGLLTSYRGAFGDLDTLGIVRFGARQIVDIVIERTAARSLIRRLIDATPGRDDDASLMDRGLHLRMFEDRERHVLEGLVAAAAQARRISRGCLHGLQRGPGPRSDRRPGACGPGRSRGVCRRYRCL